MMINILIVLSIAVVVLSYMNMNILNRSLNDLTNEQTLDMASQITYRIESHITQADKLFDIILSEPSIVGFSNNAMDEGDIMETFERYTSNYRDIAGIMIVNKNGRMISNTMEKLEDIPLNLESWYIQTVADPQRIHIFSQLIGRNVITFTIPIKQITSCP